MNTTEIQEIVFSLDTTGSMASVLTEARKKLAATTERLFREMPNVRIGLILHGDVCDDPKYGGTTYSVKEHLLSTNVQSLVDFAMNTKATNGGDSDECYELVLERARSFNWSEGASKALVMVGDAKPHGVGYTYSGSTYGSRYSGVSSGTYRGTVDWRTACRNLTAQGIRVYGVQALDYKGSRPFWQEIASLTGGFHISLAQFSEITNIIMSIVYQQNGPEALNHFETELKTKKEYTRTMESNFAVMRSSAGASYVTQVANHEPDPDRAPRSSFAVRDGDSFGHVKKTRYMDVDLEVVPPSRFQVLGVDKDIRIDDFVKENGLAFEIGQGFYELDEATVKIQDHKEIVLQDRTTGDMFSGRRARSIIGIGFEPEIRFNPKKMLSDTVRRDYRIFIQSSSSNRKLIGGTQFLYQLAAEREAVGV